MQPEFHISEEQSKRLDILKLLMAVFVVYIHSNLPNVIFSTGTVTLAAPRWFELLKYSVSELISRCAVPCFYLIASVLLYRKDFTWKDNTAKKCKSLLAPYFILNTVWIAAYAVFQAIPQTAVFFGDPNNIVANFTLPRWFQAYGIGAMYPFSGVLWFVRNLFILNLLAPVIKFIIDKFPKICLAVIAALYFLLPATNCIYLQITDLAMWCFGYFIVKWRIDINRFDDNKWVPIIYIGTIAICLMLKDFNIAVLSTALERFRLAVSIVFWYSRFTKNLNGTIQRLFQKYSKYSFGIYIFHYTPIVFAMKIIAKIFGSHIYIQILEYIFLPLIMIVFSNVLCIVLQ